jgi:hypothetical protein
LGDLKVLKKFENSEHVAIQYYDYREYSEEMPTNYLKSGENSEHYRV